MGSIPQVSSDGATGWPPNRDVQRPEDRDAACRFADRCPYTMAIFRYTDRLPLSRIGSPASRRRLVICMANMPTLAAEDLNDVLA